MNVVPPLTDSGTAAIIQIGYRTRTTDPGTNSFKVNRFDLAILELFSQSRFHPHGLHQFVEECVAGNDLLKGGLLLAVLWWLWMEPHPEQARRRELIVVAIIAAMIAAALSRAFANLVPFRARPFSTPGLHLEMPPARLFDMKGGSFPSDHMALAFSLVTGLFFIRRRLGVALAAYVLLAVGLPRMYLGIHWATDIIGGALLGVAVAALLGAARTRAALAAPFLRLMQARPAMFYACMFLVSFGLMTRFDSFRVLVSWSAHGTADVAKTVVHRLSSR
jgi:membrane-associated phospholipid phosphatase